MRYFDSVFAANSTVDLIEQVADYVCANDIQNLNNTVCHGAVSEMTEIIVPVITESLLNPEYFCSEFLGQCDSSNYYLFDAENYTDTLLKTKPANIQNDDYVNKLYQSIAGKERKILTAIHISDVHVDFKYTIGADN